MRGEFQVFHEEYLGDEPWIVTAYDAEDAAEEYAKYYDSDGDYTVVGGGTIQVRVDDASGKATWFRVQGEVVPNYMARKLRSDELKDGKPVKP